MSTLINANGVVRARVSAGEALLRSLNTLGNRFSEKELADQWLSIVSQDESVLPFGWYQPPPKGISVLIGQPVEYSRLSFTSLRTVDNWPQHAYIYNKESILYPYFSTIDRNTLMIGDHVGTYYAGDNQKTREWIRNCYHCTKKIAEQTEVGMTFSEVFTLANTNLDELGGTNNTYSINSGLASDIGHTVPFFFDHEEQLNTELLNRYTLSKRIADAREFISSGNKTIISDPCAFTIEPQILAENHPMVGFHMIVLFTEQGKIIVESYDKLFEYFGMSDWIY